MVTTRLEEGIGLESIGRLTTLRSQYSEADEQAIGDRKPVIRSALDTGGFCLTPILTLTRSSRWSTQTHHVQTP